MQNASDFNKLVETLVGVSVSFVISDISDLSFGGEGISVGGSDPGNLHCSLFHSQSPLYQDDTLSIPSPIGQSAHVTATCPPQETSSAKARLKDTSKMKEKFREIMILTEVL